MKQRPLHLSSIVHLYSSEFHFFCCVNAVEQQEKKTFTTPTVMHNFLCACVEMKEKLSLVEIGAERRLCVLCRVQLGKLCALQEISAHIAVLHLRAPPPKPRRHPEKKRRGTVARFVYSCCGLFKKMAIIYMSRLVLLCFAEIIYF